MKEYLSILNQEQLKAVSTNAQHARVIAGAGSGKTRVLTSRVAYLIDEMCTNPNRILAFTFTNKAALEMKKRVENILEIDKCGSNISTFHSFCARFLRIEICHIEGFNKNFTIIDEEDQTTIIKELKKDIDIYKQFKPEKIIGYISRCKCMGTKPSSLENIDDNNPLYIPSKVYRLYCDYLTNNNYVDFDDLLLYSVKILKENEDVRYKWQSKYDHILVDEFQDTDNTQYELIKLLLNNDTGLFVVGDPDQTIYTWRGANVDIIFNFKNDFKDSIDYVLKTNYRSTKPILDCANKLISNNKKRVPKDLYSSRTNGPKPMVYGGNSQENEADWISRTILSLRKENNLEYSDFCVLYRSNFYSGIIEQSLIRNRIPYEIYGNLKFYERKEIKDCMSYLRLIVNYDDVVAFNRIINVPKRGIGEKTLDSIKDAAEHANLTIFNYLIDKYKDDDCSPIGKFIYIIQKYHNKLNEQNINYRDFLKDLLKDLNYMSIFDPIDDEDRICNVEELGNILFNSQVNDSDITLQEIIESLTLYSSADGINDDNKVKLMTVHTAKGLEFKNCFIAGLCEGTFPNARSLRDNLNNDALEEERRLAYVAFTRAIDRLYLTYNNGFSYTVSGVLSMSRFLKEVEDLTDKYVKFNTNSKYNDVYKSSYGGVNNRSENNTVPKSKAPQLLNENADYKPGTMVVHNKYGEGIILEVDDECFKIAFKQSGVGVKLISRKFAGLKRA